MNVRLLIACLICVGASTQVYRKGPPRSVSTCEQPVVPLDLSQSTDVDRDLHDIRKERVLRVAMADDPAVLNLMDQELEGFEYTALRNFARQHRVLLRPVVVVSAQDRIQGLLEGRYDLIAGRQGPLEHDELTTIPLAERERVAVQRIDAQCNGLSLDGVDDLEGRHVVALDHTGDAAAARDLGLDLVLDDRFDQTLEEVVTDLDVDDVLIARRDLLRPLLADYDLVVGPTLRPATVAIGVRKSSVELVDALTNWTEASSESLAALERRYLQPTTHRRMAVLSPYDDLFRRESRAVGWPWRLVAALSWQESRFHPEIVSVAGATGLMQLMPYTALELGVEDPTDPEQAIRGGVNYLAQLDERWRQSLPDDHLRLPFVLASYNAGRGHVEDARALAEVNGDDPDHWPSVARWMVALESPVWNQHPSVRYGYCRGSEPADYVDAVLSRWTVHETGNTRDTPALAPVW